MVKITFKTVQNKLFTVEAEPSETVADLKKKIKETQEFPVENQKLIFSGKILQDGASVSSLNIKEKDFLVVMVSKPKAAAAAPTPVAAPPAAPSVPTPAPVVETPATTETAPTSTTTAETPSTETASTTEAAAAGEASRGGSFLSGAALQTAINQMCEMGFERSQVQKAMRASFNNADRAVEYLFSGNIPEVEGMGGGPQAPGPAATAPQPAAVPAVTAPAPTPAAPVNPTPAAQPAAPAAAAAPGGSAENLFAAAEAAMNRDRGAPAGMPQMPGGAAGGGMSPEAMMQGLAAHPQMARLREMVQQNPALLQGVLQQIATSQPELAQLLNQHPEALYELLGGAGGEDEGEDFGGPQVMQVNLTEDEVAAVERLEALGFSRQVVLQAYLLCDKNEELAANYLFDTGDEDQ